MGPKERKAAVVKIITELREAKGYSVTSEEVVREVLKKYPTAPESQVRDIVEELV